MKGPSRTAQGAAVHRAAHQLFDCPPVFHDPLALMMIGPEAERELREGRGRQVQDDAKPMRAFLAVRSRLAEDVVASAFDRGVRQYVLLGAGLDTLAYRIGTKAPQLRIFEVDHPATQAWKQQRLHQAGIPIPSNVRYAPMDFENDVLPDALEFAGFRPERAAVFAWLGVVPYLTRGAVMETLRLVARTIRNEIVFDYAQPASAADEVSGAGLKELALRVADAGEPFQSFFTSNELAHELRSMRFSHVEDWDAAKMNARYFEGRQDGLRLGPRVHLMHARV